MRSPNLFRFSLRTLLMGTILIGAGLGWYFRTRTIEQHWLEFTQSPLHRPQQFERQIRLRWQAIAVDPGRKRLPDGHCAGRAA